MRTVTGGQPQVPELERILPVGNAGQRLGIGHRSASWTLMSGDCAVQTPRASTLSHVIIAPPPQASCGVVLKPELVVQPAASADYGRGGGGVKII